MSDNSTVTAREMAALMADNVAFFREAFKANAELFDAMRPGAIRDSLIRQNLQTRRAVEELPKRIFDRQPFASKAACQDVIQEELAAILRLMDSTQAIFKNMDRDAYDRGEDQEAPR